MSFDVEKYNKYLNEALEVRKTLDEYEQEYKKIASEYEEKIKKERNKLKYRERKIKTLFPDEYFWTYDVDTSWKRPKKFSIQKIEVDSCEKLYITIKESVKKMPWDGYNLIHEYTLKEFKKLVKYKTEEKAKEVYYNRPCPKCGGVMKYANTKWCSKCMKERREAKEEFEKAHTFYYPEEGRIFMVGYTDELTRSSDKGFFGQHFTFQRLDTDEIIDTNNLWSKGFCDINEHGLPEIKFLNDKVPTGIYLSDYFR